VACTSLLTSPAARRPPPKCGAFRRQPRGSLLRQDSALEREGFEPSVPRQKDLCKHPRLPAIASAGGADRREHGENADLAPSREEIARAAVFLASDNAGFVTGQTLHVNGGSYRS